MINNVTPSNPVSVVALSMTLMLLLSCDSYNNNNAVSVVLERK